MNEDQKAKIIRFINDPTMSNIIYDILLETFNEENVGNDVHMNAAAHLSVLSLRKAWKKLENFKVEGEKNGPITRQIGM